MKKGMYRVFISYSWDSEPHKKWVRRLAERIEQDRDIDVILDQLDTWAGMDLAMFMEKALQADRVLMVLTPNYARKAARRRGGVGYENSIITGQLFKRVTDKFIPILRGDPEKSSPRYITTRRYIDMRNPHEFESGVTEILRAVKRTAPRARQSASKTTTKPRGTPLISYPNWLTVPDMGKCDLYIRTAVGKFKGFGTHAKFTDFYFQFKLEGPNWPFVYSWRQNEIAPNILGVEIGLDSTRTQEPPELEPSNLVVDVFPFDAFPIIDDRTFRCTISKGWRLMRVQTEEDLSEKGPLGLGILSPKRRDPRHTLIQFLLAFPYSSPPSESSKISLFASLDFEAGMGLHESWEINAPVIDRPTQGMKSSQ